MCNPALVAVVGLAISAAGAGYQVHSANQAADAQTEAAELQLALQQEAIDAQTQQINEQTGEELSDRARQARREQAALRVYSGEAGVAGNSITSLLNDVSVQAGFDNARIEKNRTNAIEQTQRDLQGFQLNKSLKIQTAEARRTDAQVAAGFQVAGSAVDSYSGYQSAKAKKDKAKEKT